VLTVLQSNRALLNQSCIIAQVHRGQKGSSWHSSIIRNKHKASRPESTKKSGMMQNPQNNMMSQCNIMEKGVWGVSRIRQPSLNERNSISVSHAIPAIPKKAVPMVLKTLHIEQSRSEHACSKSNPCHPVDTPSTCVSCVANPAAQQNHLPRPPPQQAQACVAPSASSAVADG
jgi:hypothetical protein